MLHACRALGVAPARALMVGDDRRDIEAARGAGMGAIVAGYGYLGDGEPSERWPANGWLRAPRDLLDWLPAA